MTVLKKSMLLIAVSLLAWAQVSFAGTPNTILTSETGESIVSKVNDEQTQISFMYCNSNNECSNIGKESYEIELIEKQIDLEDIKMGSVFLLMMTGAVAGALTSSPVVLSASFIALVGPMFSFPLESVGFLPSSFNFLHVGHHFNVQDTLINALAKSAFDFSSAYHPTGLPAVVSDDKFQSFLESLKEGLADTDLILRYDRLMLR